MKRYASLMQRALPQAAALGKVAVLMGGHSAERDISMMSGRGVLQALLGAGVDAHAFDPATRALDELAREGFARCFIALHGRWGEDGCVQGALEWLGIPYTGPGVMASAVAMDKTMTKRIWQVDGLSTPRWIAFDAAQLQGEEAIASCCTQAIGELGLPLVVKPPHEGSSIGVHKAASAQQVRDALAQVAQMDAAVLCEACIVGEELTCPVLGSGSEALALPVVRIVAPDGNYDYEQKYFTDAVRYLCPCDLPRDQESAIQQLSLDAYRALGCRGWARMDVMVRGADRQAFLLEANTSPGMTAHSLVPMSAKVAGMDYAALCMRLLQDAALDNPRTAKGPHA